MAGYNCSRFPKMELWVKDSCICNLLMSRGHLHFCCELIIILVYCSKTLIFFPLIKGAIYVRHITLCLWYKLQIFFSVLYLSFYVMYGCIYHAKTLKYCHFYKIKVYISIVYWFWVIIQAFISYRISHMLLPLVNLRCIFFYI